MICSVNIARSKEMLGFASEMDVGIEIWDVQYMTVSDDNDGRDIGDNEGSKFSGQ